MNNKILKTIAILCLPIMAQAQTLHVNNATFYVSPGATVQVNGDVLNSFSSNYQNKGTVIITGDFENNQTMPSPTSGTTRFEGTATQTVKGFVNLKTFDVVFNNANGIYLNRNLEISNQAYFNNGIVTSNGSKVVFLSGASIGNTPSDSSHVNCDVVNLGTGSFTYPVGDGIRYQPITINLTANDGMIVRYYASNAVAAPFTSNGTEATPLIAYNASEYWECGPNGGTCTGTMTMYWDDYNNTGITNVADLKVAHQSNGEWVNEGTTATGTIASGSVTSNVLNSWSPFTLGSISMNSPLPVTLLSFTGKKEATANVLNWATSMEQNNAYFNVQRSTDANEFNTIGKVEAKQLSINHYELRDEKPQIGHNYYRLQQVDLDGKTTLSQVIDLYRDANGNVVSIYPNPTQGILNIECFVLQEGNTTIALSDMSGRMMKEVQVNTIKGMNTLQLDIHELTNGMYMLQTIQNGQLISTQKVEKK